MGKKTIWIVLGSILAAFVIFFGTLLIFVLTIPEEDGGRDTVEVLSKGVEIGKWWDGTGMPDFQLVILYKEGINSAIEENIYLYRVIKPYVYTINKDNRYTVFDYIKKELVCQTNDYEKIDPIHQAIFNDKSQFNDIIYPYRKTLAEYPKLDFGDGTIYLLHNTRTGKYTLRSKIEDGEAPLSDQREVTGLPFEYVEKVKIEAPFVMAIDQNGKRALVNFETHQCVYNEYVDKIGSADLNAFEDINSFVPVQDVLK